MNIRLSHLTKKTFNKMKELYLSPQDDIYAPINKASDFEITEDPTHSKMPSIAKRIETNIFTDPHRVSRLTSFDFDSWTYPDPKY